MKNKKIYNVATTAVGGTGSVNSLSDNKFITADMVGLTYEELFNLKYKNIYAIELLPDGKYRTLNVIQI